MYRSFFVNLMVVGSFCSSVVYSVEDSSQGFSGKPGPKREVTTPQGKTITEVTTSQGKIHEMTVPTMNGGSVSVYELGTVANGVMLKGVAVTSPDTPVTFTTPTEPVKITLPTGETKTIYPKPIVIDLPTGRVIVKPGTSITIPSDTTIAVQKTSGDVTVSTKKPHWITIAGTNPPIVVRIPAGTSYIIPEGTTLAEASSSDGLTNFNDATGWTTSTIIKSSAGTGHTLFMPGSPSDVIPSPRETTPSS